MVWLRVCIWTDLSWSGRSQRTRLQPAKKVWWGWLLTGRLLRAKGKSGTIYDSAKRTQFFSTKNQHLTYGTIRCYALKKWAKYLGSFWKTNPILRGIYVRFIEKWVPFASAL